MIEIGDLLIFNNKKINLSISQIVDIQDEYIVRKYLFNRDDPGSIGMEVSFRKNERILADNTKDMSGNEKKSTLMELLK